MFKLYFLFIILIVAGVGCSASDGTNATDTSSVNGENDAAEAPAPAATPSNQFTEADLAKLKWLEGSWKGTDKDKAFFSRIRFEGSAMIVETFADETMSRVSDTSRFELKEGRFGNVSAGTSGSAASSITDTAVQFVPAETENNVPARAKGSTFRFERAGDGTSWYAVLATPAKGDQPAGEMTYKMEPWKPQAGKQARVN